MKKLCPLCGEDLARDIELFGDEKVHLHKLTEYAKLLTNLSVKFCSSDRTFLGAELLDDIYEFNKKIIQLNKFYSFFELS